MLVQLVELGSIARRSYPGPAETFPTGTHLGNGMSFDAARPVGFLSNNDNVRGYDANRRVAGTAYYRKGRGAWISRKRTPKMLGAPSANLSLPTQTSTCPSM